MPAGSVFRLLRQAPRMHRIAITFSITMDENAMIELQWFLTGSLRDLDRVATRMRAVTLLPGRRARDRRGAVLGSEGGWAGACLSVPVGGATCCLADALARVGELVGASSST